MKATVISMASAKGGSGKTIITATFATLLASLGKRVLMVDTDAATNGLSLFFLGAITEEIAQAETRLLGLFESSPEDSQRFVEIAPNLLLLPATYGFRNTENTDLHTYKVVLQNLISRFRQEFEFIFLDAQAGSDAFAEAAISEEVSDQVVIVSEYDPMSAAGVERLKAIFPESLSFQRTWVLLNKMLPDFIKSFSDFMEVVKYLSPLPWNAEVVRAYARRTLPLDTDAGNEYTLAVVQTLRSILPATTRHELEVWLETRAVELRSPIKAQLEDARRELSVLRERRTVVRKRRQLVDIMIVITATTIGLVGGLTNYFLDNVASISSRISLSAAIFVGAFAIGTALTRQVRRLFPTDLETDDDFKADLEFAADRVRRLSELSDLDFEELIKKGRGSTYR